MNAYMSFTVHFIDDNWENKKSVLSVSQFDEKHTAENILQNFEQIKKQWEIEEKLMFITSDNAFNVTKACKGLNIFTNGCFAHQLNLIIKNSLQNFENLDLIIKRIKDLVNVIKNSVLLTNKFKENQSLLKLPNHKLIQFVKTRWNSVYYLLSRFVEQEKAIKLTIPSDVNDE